MDFHASYMTHFDGHVDNCRHFDHSRCDCGWTELQKELMYLRETMFDQEKQIESYQVKHEQARIEVARLRSIIKWQNKSLEQIKTAIVKNVLND